MSMQTLIKVTIIKLSARVMLLTTTPSQIPIITIKRQKTHRNRIYPHVKNINNSVQIDTKITITRLLKLCHILKSNSY